MNKPFKQSWKRGKVSWKTLPCKFIPTGFSFCFFLSTICGQKKIKAGVYKAVPLNNWMSHFRAITHNADNSEADRVSINIDITKPGYLRSLVVPLFTWLVLLPPTCLCPQCGNSRTGLCDIYLMPSYGLYTVCVTNVDTVFSKYNVQTKFNCQ